MIIELKFQNFKRPNFQSNYLRLSPHTWLQHHALLEGGKKRLETKRKANIHQFESYCKTNDIKAAVGPHLFERGMHCWWKPGLADLNEKGGRR